MLRIISNCLRRSDISLCLQILLLLDLVFYPIYASSALWDLLNVADARQIAPRSQTKWNFAEVIPESLNVMKIIYWVSPRKLWHWSLCKTSHRLLCLLFFLCFVLIVFLFRAAPSIITAFTSYILSLDTLLGCFDTFLFFWLWFFTICVLIHFLSHLLFNDF